MSICCRSNAASAGPPGLRVVDRLRDSILQRDEHLPAIPGPRRSCNRHRCRFPRSPLRRRLLARRHGAQPALSHIGIPSARAQEKNQIWGALPMPWEAARGCPWGHPAWVLAGGWRSRPGPRRRCGCVPRGRRVRGAGTPFAPAAGRHVAACSQAVATSSTCSRASNAIVRM